MRRTLGTVFALALTALAFPSAAEPVVVGRFRLQSNPWVNLHQRLMHAARFGGAASGELSADGLAEWSTAVASYRTFLGNRSPFVNAGLMAVDRALSLTWGNDAPASVDSAAAAALRRVMPAYRRDAWPTDDRINRFWISIAQPLLDSAGEELMAEHGRIYGRPMPAVVHVDVAPVAWQFGAYTVGDAAAVYTVVSSTDAGYQGFAALEMLLHEPSHGVVDVNHGALGDEINAAAEELGLQPHHSLWHALLFQTAGELTRRALARRGVSDYVPVVYRGMWEAAYQGLQKPIETHWSAYLDGKVSRADAIRAIVRETSKPRRTSMMWTQ